MMIREKDRADYLKILCILFMSLGSAETFANQLDDQGLAEQSAGVIRLAPIVIQAVKKDVQQPIDEQNDLHGQIAKKRADEAKKEEIYSTVLTDFEWQKKDRDSVKAGDKYITPYEKYKLIEVGYNPYQRHDVRITTADRVYFWPGYEIDTPNRH